MSIKSANVSVRVEPEIKKQAEEIMSKLGIPVSTAINMLYRQIIYTKSLYVKKFLCNITNIR